MFSEMCLTCQDCNAPLPHNLVISPKDPNMNPATNPSDGPDIPNVFFPSHDIHSKAIDMPIESRANHGDDELDNPMLSNHRRTFSDDSGCEGMIIGTTEAKVKIIKIINQGSFGRLYTGEFVESGNKCAVKVEDQGTGHEKLMSEGNLIRKLEGGPGIPKLYWYGMHGSEFNFMVMDYYGPNLLDLMESCDGSFTLPTVLKITQQLLATLHFIHDQNIMHRDISPRNIVIGTGDNRDKLYLIDFGLAKGCSRQGKIVLPSPTRYGAFCNGIVGTPRFSSINTHRGGIVGRSDDLEAIGYLLVYLLKGSLPWQEGIESPEDLQTTDRLKRVEKLKIMTPMEDLCADIPEEFGTLISYARLLKYHEMPDYKSLSILFDRLIETMDINMDAPFDWAAKRNRLKSSPSIVGMRRSRQSMPKISCGSDESFYPSLCGMCETDVHFTLNSA